MRTHNVQWHLLRGALCALGFAVASGIVVLGGAELYLQEKELRYQRQRADLNRGARLYRNARHDRSLYSQYVKVYENLQRQGVIGSEPRLDWVEALERINRTLRLPVLRYEIQPQTPVELQGNRYDARIIRVYRSAMSFDAGLLHEGDLLVLLNELRRQTNGRFQVRDCDIRFTSAARPVVFDVRKPNLVAFCNLDWYTLRIVEREAREDSGS